MKRILIIIMLSVIINGGDGYKGIWFSLNQIHNGLDKYSGGLGTFTAKHIPLAVYSDKVNKTFFVYGGVSDSTSRELMCMVGEFDHNTNLLRKPKRVYCKHNVNDPHDNPTIMIDDDGFIYIYISGRSKVRKGIKLKSDKPYSISDGFTIIEKSEFTYPQIWNTDFGVVHLFTRYNGIRLLYCEYKDSVYELVNIKNGNMYSGHYQVSNYSNGKLGTFFNYHINGNCDKRTNLYFIETIDGYNWHDICGNNLKLPITGNSPIVKDYQKLKKNVYLKDMKYYHNKPMCLYIISNGFESGSINEPYEWMVAKWNGDGWETVKLLNADHNYDQGSIIIFDDIIYLVIPVGNSPQAYAGGGEVMVYKFINNKAVLCKQTTKNSIYNNNYVRYVLHGKPPFNYFWSNGNPFKFSKCELFFGDLDGNAWKMPYNMNKEFNKPIKVK